MNRKKAPRTMPRITKNVILKLQLKGPGIRTGRIAIPELVRICEEAQNVMTRQAEAMQGRSTIHPGPTTNTIIEECTLELVGLKSGSTVLEFELARPQRKLDETASFGSDVVKEVANSIKTITLNRRRKPKAIDEGVLQAIYGLSGVVEGKKITEINWVAPIKGKSPLKAPVTRAVRQAAAKKLSQPRRARLEVDGVLEMADFRHEDRKCRIVPAIRAPVTCTFSEEKADTIQGLLRKPVKIQGEASLQPITQRVLSISIETIEPLESLSLGKGDFFSSRSIQSLAKIQDVQPIKKASDLAGGLPEDEDVDEFLDDIYRAREAQ